MTPGDRAARATRAEQAYREFFEPMLDELKNAYSERIVDVANTVLNPNKRRDMMTALSNALKILGTLDSGMQAIISDGDMAKQELLRADRIEQMTAPARRLLGIAPY